MRRLGGEGNTASEEHTTVWGEGSTASGTRSTAFGYENTASGAGSTAFGFKNNASGSTSTAWGVNNEVSDTYTTAWGSANNATEYLATAWGSGNVASGNKSTAWGYFNTAAGNNATVAGFENEAPSYCETTFGVYAKTYTANSATSWDANDRLFSLGNGVSAVNRSNALTIYKNDTMNLNDAYDMPMSDGSSGQVMTTNGNGVVSWSSANGTDDLGNHTTTTNIQLNNQWLINDGDNEGFYIKTDGDVGLGTSSPSHDLDLYQSEALSGFPTMAKQACPPTSVL